MGAAGLLPERPPSRAVFLDRDGVLIRDVDHLRTPDQIEVLPGVPEALRDLRAAGWRLIVVTNQSVVARGWVSELELHRIHRTLASRLRDRGAELDAIYYCPHHPAAVVPEYRVVCQCRKPAPGMLLRAAREWAVDLGASVLVGDSPSDVEAGRRAGTRTVLIRPPGGEAGPDLAPGPVDYVACDLADAARWILARA